MHAGMGHYTMSHRVQALYKSRAAWALTPPRSRGLRIYISYNGETDCNLAVAPGCAARRRPP